MKQLLYAHAKIIPNANISFCLRARFNRTIVIHVHTRDIARLYFTVIKYT